MSMYSSSPKTPVLMADQDTDTCLLIMDAWEEAGLGNLLRFVQDGKNLENYLYQRKPYSDSVTYPRPGLIVVDWSILKSQTEHTLKKLKSDPTFRTIPTIILGSQGDLGVIPDAHLMPSCSFMSKPQTFQGRLNMMRTIRNVWANPVNLPFEEFEPSPHPL